MLAQVLEVDRPAITRFVQNREIFDAESFPALQVDAIEHVLAHDELRNITFSYWVSRKITPEEIELPYAKVKDPTASLANPTRGLRPPAYNGMRFADKSSPLRNDLSGFIGYPA